MVSVSSLCDNGRTVDSSKKNCFVRKKGTVIAIGERTSGMYSIELQGADGKAMITPHISRDILHVWRSRHAYADKTSIKQTMAIKTVVSFDKFGLQSVRSYFPCVDGMMPNSAIKSKSTL